MAHSSIRAAAPAVMAAARLLPEPAATQRDQQIYPRCCQIRSYLIIRSKPSASLVEQTVVSVLISSGCNTSHRIPWCCDCVIRGGLEEIRIC